MSLRATSMFTTSVSSTLMRSPRPHAMAHAVRQIPVLGNHPTVQFSSVHLPAATAMKRSASCVTTVTTTMTRASILETLRNLENLTAAATERGEMCGRKAESADRVNHRQHCSAEINSDRLLVETEVENTDDCAYAVHRTTTKG